METRRSNSFHRTNVNVGVADALVEPLPEVSMISGRIAWRIDANGTVRILVRCHNIVYGSSRTNQLTWKRRIDARLNGIRHRQNEWWLDIEMSARMIKTDVTSLTLWFVDGVVHSRDVASLILVPNRNWSRPKLRFVCICFPIVRASIPIWRVKAERRTKVKTTRRWTTLLWCLLVPRRSVSEERRCKFAILGCVRVGNGRVQRLIEDLKDEAEGQWTVERCKQRTDEPFSKSSDVEDRDDEGGGGGERSVLFISSSAPSITDKSIREACTCRLTWNKRRGRCVCIGMIVFEGDSSDWIGDRRVHVQKNEWQGDWEEERRAEQREGERQIFSSSLYSSRWWRGGERRETN